LVIGLMVSEDKCATLSDYILCILKTSVTLKLSNSRCTTNKSRNLKKYQTNEMWDMVRMVIKNIVIGVPQILWLLIILIGITYFKVQTLSINFIANATKYKVFQNDCVVVS
jgi:ribosomal protein L6P/L9E